MSEIRRALKVLIIGIVLCVGKAHGKQINAFLSSVSEYTCRGKPIDDKFLETNKRERNFKLLVGFAFSMTTEGQKIQLQKAISVEHPEDISPEERILAANILISARTKRFDKVEGFLNFSSPDPVIESYRILYLGVLKSLQGNYSEAYQLIAKAIEILPYTDESMINTIVSIANRLDPHPVDVSKYYSYIEFFPETSASKYLLMANKEMLEGNWPKRSVEISQMFKKAYALCPNDTSIAFANAAIEESTGNIDRARELYLGIISDHLYYPPDIDSRLLRIYFEKQNSSKTKIFLEKCHTNWEYLSPQERDVVRAIEKNLNTKVEFRMPDENNYYSIFIGLSVVIIAGIFFLRSKKS